MPSSSGGTSKTEDSQFNSNSNSNTNSNKQKISITQSKRNGNNPKHNQNNINHNYTNYTNYQQHLPHNNYDTYPHQPSQYDQPKAQTHTAPYTHNNNNHSHNNNHGTHNIPPHKMHTNCNHPHHNQSSSFVRNKIDPSITYASKSTQQQTPFDTTVQTQGFGSFSGFDHIPNLSSLNSSNNTTNNNQYNNNTTTNNNNNNNFNNTKNTNNTKPNASNPPNKNRPHNLTSSQRRHNRRTHTNNNINNLNPNVRQQNTWDKIPYHYDFATRTYYNKFDTQFEDKILLNKMGRSKYTKDEQCPKIILLNIDVNPHESDSLIINKLAEFSNEMQQNGNDVWNALNQEDILQVQIYRTTSKSTTVTTNNNNNNNNNDNISETDDADNEMKEISITTEHTLPPVPATDPTQLNQPNSNTNNPNNLHSHNPNHDPYPNPNRAQHIIHIPNNKSPHFYLPHTTYVDITGNNIKKSDIPITQHNSVIITINPHGHFMQKCPNNWQKMLCNNWLNQSSLGKNVSIYFKQCNEIYEFHMALNNIRISDSNLKTNIFDLINNDRINNDPNSKIDPHKIIAIKRWNMGSTNKLSIFMSGPSPTTFPTHIGIKPWRIIPVTLPTNHLTDAQKRAKQIPFCRACLNVGHYIYQCSRFKSAKTKYRQQMKYKYKNNNRLINEAMRNWRYKCNICQNCGKYGHLAHNCNDTTYCKRCKSHDHTSQFNFNCSTIQNAAYLTFKYQQQWNQILTNNEPLPIQPAPTEMGQINCQWNVPQSFIQTKQELGPPIPTSPPDFNNSQANTHFNPTTPNHRTNQTHNNQSRKHNHRPNKSTPRQTTHSTHPQNPTNPQATPQSNRSKKRSSIELLNKDFDRDDNEFKRDPKNEYYISTDLNPTPHKRPRLAPTKQQNKDQHDYIMNTINQNQQIPSIYTQAFQSHKYHTDNNNTNSNKSIIINNQNINNINNNNNKTTNQNHTNNNMKISNNKILNNNNNNKTNIHNKNNVHNNNKMNISTNPHVNKNVNIHTINSMAINNKNINNNNNNKKNGKNMNINQIDHGNKLKQLTKEAIQLKQTQQPTPPSPESDTDINMLQLTPLEPNTNNINNNNNSNQHTTPKPIPPNLTNNNETPNPTASSASR